MDRRQRLGTVGLTLIEMLISMVILSLATLGMMVYQYETARQTRMARVQISATRIAQLLLEDWKANGASARYDPELMNLGISHISGGDGFDAEGNSYKIYRSVASNTPVRIELSRPTGFFSPIPITVTIRWRNDYSDGAIREQDPAISLATYASGDEAAG